MTLRLDINTQHLTTKCVLVSNIFMTHDDVTRPEGAVNHSHICAFSLFFCKKSVLEVQNRQL